MSRWRLKAVRFSDHGPNVPDGQFIASVLRLLRATLISERDAVDFVALAREYFLLVPAV